MCVFVCEHSEADAHKERLLRFDREFARRMVVVDDQEDHYSGNGTWLTEEEKEDVTAKEEARFQDMHTRKKQVLNLVI